MHRRLLLTFAALLLIALSIQSDAIVRRTTAVSFVAQNKTVPAPEDILGFRPGDDRHLAGWAKVIEYFQKLAAASNRVKFEEIGKSTMGAPFVCATISAPENLKRLDDYRKMQELLADPRKLGPPGVRDRKVADLIAHGKTIVAITCGIHSTEVGSYLSSMLIAHRLASSNDPEIQEVLRNTIILLVPATNPDGVDIVKNWYDKTLGTPYEGTDPPELYHKYTGHDDNRDWYAFTQVETQLTVDRILNVWHPQIVHDIHQQGALGSRLFLPPYMQPVEPNVPQQIVEGYTELGNYIAANMRAEGFKGITQDSTYDAWSPSRAYSHYHGGVRILSETASCRLATPITVKFEQLQSREGYDPQKESANFGPLWPGGEWRLRDITNNMTTAAFLLLKHAAQNRAHWLQRFYEIEKDTVRPRKKGELFAYLLLPPKDREQGIRRLKLMGVLARGGIVFEMLNPSDLKGNPILNTLGLLVPSIAKKIDVNDLVTVVRMDQPGSAFAKALLETQKYPDLRDAAGHPIAPYDVTSHSLSMLFGVSVQPVYEPLSYKLAWPKVEGIAGRQREANTRLAIYRSYTPSIDEGWTRWVLEKEFAKQPYSQLEDREVHLANLREHFDAIIIPDQPRNAILNGHRPGTMPPEYTGGLGEKGVKALREFVEQGGTLICLNRASDFAIEQFKLPLRDVVDGLPRTDFYVPGSILRIEIDTSSPIAKGMPKESIAWVENSPVFEVNAGSADVSSALSAQREQKPADETSALPASHVKIIAWYPRDRDPLLSGWLLGGDRIKGKAALVEVGMGKGRIILFGFRPQYRGQSLATYPFFFNALTQP
jgi:hypothetical protein